MPTPSKRAALAVAATGLIAAAPVACAQAAHAADYPPGLGDISVSTSLVIVGGHLTFTATLPSGPPILVQVTLPSLPTALPGAASRGVARRAPLTQRLATFTADPQGHVSGQVTIPANTAPGDYQLTVTAPGSKHVLSTPIRVSLPRTNASANVQLNALDTAYKKPLATSGSGSPSRQATAAAGLAVGVGAAVVAVRRRRSRNDQD
jgi:hypothetical protein